MDVVGNPAHRQRIQSASTRLAVKQGGDVEGVGIEQIQHLAKIALKLGKPVLVSPSGDPAFADRAE
jgi:hypothetical protein